MPVCAALAPTAFNFVNARVLDCFPMLQHVGNQDPRHVLANCPQRVYSQHILHAPSAHVKTGIILFKTLMPPRRRGASVRHQPSEQLVYYSHWSTKGVRAIAASPLPTPSPLAHSTPLGKAHNCCRKPPRHLHGAIPYTGPPCPCPEAGCGLWAGYSARPRVARKRQFLRGAPPYVSKLPLQPRTSLTAYNLGHLRQIQASQARQDMPD